MNKQQIYASLEARMLTYQDLIRVSVVPQDEPLVPITETPTLAARQFGKDMIPYTGDQVFVRQSLLAKLGQAGLLLAELLPGAQLQVVYGYRALSVQAALFEAAKRRVRGTVPESALQEAAHRLIAVPDISGHPTGGAVDIQIVRGREPLDFGTRIWEFTPDSYTFSPFISPAAQSNRLLLRNVMMDAGFAPFDGEWWHFSYGDKEWAGYYRRPAALFEQTEFKV